MLAILPKYRLYSTKGFSLSFTYALNPNYEYFKSKLFNIKKIFNSSNESIHKARNELKIVEIYDLKCVVKSFKVPIFINRIAYTFFRDSKAMKSFKNAQILRELDVNTPEPIGVIQFYESALISQSYFISLYEPYDFTIREVFHHKVDEYKDILKEFAKFTYDLHKKGVWHVDYSLGNILITKEKDSYRFSLVDINRMKFKNIKGYDGLKNFSKFWAKDDEDLIILATEYAKLAELDEKTAIKLTLSEAKKLEKSVNFKKALKGKK